MVIAVYIRCMAVALCCVYLCFYTSSVGASLSLHLSSTSHDCAYAICQRSLLWLSVLPYIFSQRLVLTLCCHHREPKLFVRPQPSCRCGRRVTNAADGGIRGNVKIDNVRDKRIKQYFRDLTNSSHQKVIADSYDCRRTVVRL